LDCLESTEFGSWVDQLTPPKVGSVNLEQIGRSVKAKAPDPPRNSLSPEVATPVAEHFFERRNVRIFFSLGIRKSESFLPMRTNNARTDD
jgi:hypothetical protein